MSSMREAGVAIEDFVDRKERHILEEILRELKGIKRILEPKPKFTLSGALQLQVLQ